jgi:hypothetical protein
LLNIYWRTFILFVSCKRATSSFHWVVFQHILHAPLFHLHLARDYTGRKAAPTAEAQIRDHSLHSRVPSLLSNTATTNQRHGRSCSETGSGFTQRACSVSTSYLSCSLLCRGNTDSLSASSNPAPTLISRSPAVATRTRSTRSSFVGVLTSSPAR